MKARQGRSSVRSNKGFFYPKQNRAWEGDEHLLDQLAALALIINPPTSCFVIEYVNPPVYRGGYLLFWAAAHRPYQIEQELIIFFITMGQGSLPTDYGALS
jgi:hypothetical protein